MGGLGAADYGARDRVWETGVDSTGLVLILASPLFNLFFLRVNGFLVVYSEFSLASTGGGGCVGYVLGEGTGFAAS